MKNEHFTANNTINVEILSEKIAQNYTLMAISRDPIDRFLSGYLDICIRLIFINTIKRIAN